MPPLTVRSSPGSEHVAARLPQQHGLRLETTQLHRRRPRGEHALVAARAPGLLRGFTEDHNTTAHNLNSQRHWCATMACWCRWWDHRAGLGSPCVGLPVGAAGVMSLGLRRTNPGGWREQQRPRVFDFDMVVLNNGILWATTKYNIMYNIYRYIFERVIDNSK